MRILYHKRIINDNLESQLQIAFDKDLTCLLKKEALSNDYELTSLSNMADYINGLAMQNYPAQNDVNSLLVLKIRELRQGFCDEKSDKCTSDLAPQYVIHNGDIIFSWSGSLLVDIWTGGQVGLNQHLFNVVSNNYPKCFTYLWTKFHLENFIRIAEGKKTSMGHIKREDLDSAKVIVPNARILCDMDKRYTPIFNELTRNKIEFNVLRRSQDLLLSTLSR